MVSSRRPETNVYFEELTANLAFELSERDDDGDWEIEDMYGWV